MTDTGHVPLTDDERDRLIRYIQARTCEEFRQGSPCLDRSGDTPVEMAEPHPGCSSAAEMVALVQRA
jgi:hypothetical protein